MTPGRPCYFDHYQSENREHEPLAIGGYNSLKAVYSYYPIPEEISPENQRYVLGAQANVWTEYIPDSKQVEYMLLPRLCALSEVVWTGCKKKDFSDFERRMKRHYTRLTSWGINYRKSTSNAKF
jgi:hexosaminidase